MRINLLKVNAFGPFKSETIFDFNKLNKAGLFLITGPTGVGKTSIFDAICYALYGEISGFDGILDKVRSDYAKVDDLTFVELDFTINNINYYIRREPTQQVIGRGNKEVMHNHQVVLTYLDKQVVGPSNVSKTINEIIGLNSNLFRQVVMIPQGQFIKLLSASSEEKSGIFRSIFNTKNILDFQKDLFEETKNKSSEIDDIRKKINTRIIELNIDDELNKMVNCDCPNYPEIFSYLSDYIEKSDYKVKALLSDFEDANCQYMELEKKHETIKNLNENYHLLMETKEKKKAIENQSPYFSTLEKRLSKYHFAKNLEEIINEINEGNSKIKEINKNIEENNNKKEKLNQIYDEITKSIQELDSKQSEIETIKKEIFILNQELINSQNMEKAQEERKQFLDSSIPLNKALEELKEEYKNELMYSEELEQKQDILSNNRGNDIQIFQTKEKLVEKQKRLEEIEKKYQRLNEISDLIVKGDEEFNRICEEYMEYSNKKAKLVRAKETNLASSLARDLPENAPCPVCGATHHPKLAHFDEDVEKISMETIDKKLEDINASLKSISKENNNLKKEKIDISEYLENDKTILEEKENKESLDRVIEAIEATNITIKNINDNKEEKEKIDVEIKLNKERMSILEQKIDEKKKDLSDNEKKIIELNTKIEMFNTSKTKDEITNCINEKRAIIEDYNNKIQNYRDEKDRINTEVIDISSKLIKDTATTSEIEKSIINREQQKQILWEKFLDESEYNSCLMSDNEYDIKSKELSEYKSQGILIEGEINRLNDLVGEYQYQDLSTITCELEEKKQMSDNKNEAYRSFKQELNNIMSKQISIKNDYNNCEKKIQNYEIIAKISRIANGNNDLKMSFENYILSVYFEDILSVANGLLATITKNRYQLIRRDTRASGNARQGLDTLVYDSNTGKMRDVKTLSGGESFKTALCLALGLSEIIRRKSSIISINTLFIDEGFGSLDPSSLDSALEILMQMKNNDCVIGIISHVSELKNRIYDKIVLEPTTDGTIAKIIA